MSLSAVLTEKSVAIGLSAKDKTGVIDELIGILRTSGQIGDAEAARRAVLEREEKMSTGMKNGIAIPHGKSSSVKSLVACVGISKDPIPFDALDGEPCRIFIMTISPPESTGPHLRFLAEVSQLFKSAEKRAAAVAAASPAELLAVISSR